MWADTSEGGTGYRRRGGGGGHPKKIVDILRIMNIKINQLHLNQNFI